jgi:transposase
MDARDAELIYAAGKDVVITALLQLAHRVEELEEQVRQLEKKVADLSRNSTNSSKPPSSDGPAVTRPKKAKSRRSRGGQKGHPGHTRDLVPVEQVDHIIDHYPDQCEHCGASLDPRLSRKSTEPWRHQVFELPEIKATVTEHRCHELVCSCGRKTRGLLPEDVAATQFGPRVHAAIAYLSSVHKVGRRGIVEIMNTLFGLDLALGTVCNCVERVNQELEPVAEDLRETLAESSHLNIDETGWKCQGKRRYLWTFVSAMVVYFAVRASRGSQVLREVVGETFAGVIISDDHSAYSAYHKHGIRQLCWAHLIRKFKDLKDRRASPDACVFARNMLREVGHIFSCWHAFREGYLERQQLLAATQLMRARMKKYCLAYRDSADAQVRTRARRTLKNWDHLFTFLIHEGVEPTNNLSEQALRPAVQWRKLSFGNQSESGERFTERILTITRTCQLHRRNAFEYLAVLMQAAFKGEARPSVLQ